MKIESNQNLLVNKVYYTFFLCYQWRTCCELHSLPERFQFNSLFMQDLPRASFDPWTPRLLGVLPGRFRVNSAHIRQSKPESGPGFQITVSETFLSRSLFARQR